MKITTALLLAASLLPLGSVLAENIKTINGTEYKDATITRVEPDGIMVMHSAGIVKIPFEELPDEFRKKYNHDPQAAAAFRNQLANAAAQRQRETAEALDRQRQAAAPVVPHPTAAVTAKGTPMQSHSMLSQPASNGSITLDSLFKDYAKNEIRADQQYKGRTFTIGGTVKAISNTGNGPTVELKVASKGSSVYFAEAHFRSDDGLVQYAIGRPISFNGTVDGVRSLTLHIKDCVLPR